MIINSKQKENIHLIVLAYATTRDERIFHKDELLLRDTISDLVYFGAREYNTWQGEMDSNLPELIIIKKIQAILEEFGQSEENESN